MSRRTWRPMVSLTAVIVEGNQTYRTSLPMTWFNSHVSNIFTAVNIERFKMQAYSVLEILRRKPDGT